MDKLMRIRTIIKLAVGIPRKKKIIEVNAHKRPNLDAKIFGATLISFFRRLKIFDNPEATHLSGLYFCFKHARTK